MNTNDPSKKASINSLLNPQRDHDYQYSLRAASWDLPHPSLEPKPSGPPPRHPDYPPAPDMYDCWQPGERASLRLAARGSVQAHSTHPQSDNLQHDARYGATAAPVYYPSSIMQYTLHSPSHSESPPQSHYTQQPCPPNYSPRSLHTPYSQPPGQSSAQQGQEHVPFQTQPGNDADSEPGSPGSNSRKRSQPDSKAQTEQQSKRAKGKAKAASEGSASVAAPARRGYTAEKRSKVQQIAQNARMHVVTGDNGQVNGLVTENAIPLQPELQFARCMSNRYRTEQFPRCVSCTRRWAGDTCRFQGIRFFLKDKKRDIVGISFVEGRYQDAPKMVYPTRWNVPLKEAHIKRMKLSIAKALLPILKKEYEHIKLPELIRRPRESEVRATCDTCMTSLFSCTWMCRLCGREACAECFAQVKELTVDKPNANQAELAALQARRDKHTHCNPFFLSCTKRNEHMAKDFSPVSRFFLEELDEAIPEMERLLAEEAGVNSNGHPNAMPELSSSSSNGSTSASSSVDNTLSSILHTNTNGPTPSPAYIPPNLPPITASLPYNEIKRYAYAEVTHGDSISVFAPIWQRGEPIVVTGCLDHFQIKWTPEYFVKHYGEQTCLIIECQTDVNKRVTVGDFFQMFGKYNDRTECWKLKDWPPSTDFKTAFPELYKDFSDAVPVPDYVRRDVGSHFPSNTIAPDLGPKMYNALASSLQEGSRGTTKLHMDMADAVNIMTYAENSPDGSLGCAAWDLFRASDSDKLRSFLRSKFPKQSAATDPIHAQVHYLDEQLRKELYEQYGVMSYRIYQRPGEAVFIPAGCAHQVARGEYREV
ncbi:Lysine-specific demethylase 3A [Leucoagaricus sp. SymC.cos]|nr:Lysine-specific demethylase 3A [Leucoagaricus sp. SymC.cos]